MRCPRQPQISLSMSICMRYRRRTWYDWVRGQNGDAILFTEALRHGGVTNHKNETRMTLHVGYGPYWMMSQNIATMDEPLFIKPETWKRYNTEQKELFQPWLRQGPEYQLT